MPTNPKLKIVNIEEVPRIGSLVYVIEFENLCCKIGRSKNPRQRIREITRSNPLKTNRIAILSPCLNASEIEKTLHEIFFSQRINSEYFQVSFESIESEAQNLPIKYFFTDEEVNQQVIDAERRYFKDPNSVIAQAFDGYVTDVADELGLTYQRVGEIVGKDNPYPKLWRILNPLGRMNAERLLMVKADFNARVDRVVGTDKTPSTASSVHKEITEAMQKILDRAPPEQQTSLSIMSTSASP